MKGQTVYITEQYYKDIGADVIDIPRFGWVVTSIVNDEATIEYQRKNLKLNMTLLIDTKYLLKEV